MTAEDPSNSSNKRTSATSQENGGRSFDAFAYYSSRSNLVNSFLARGSTAEGIVPTRTSSDPGCGGGASSPSCQGQDPAESANNKRRKNNRSRPVQDGARRTRLAVELHPSLLLVEEDYTLLEDDCELLGDELLHTGRPVRRNSI